MTYDNDKIATMIMLLPLILIMITLKRTRSVTTRAVTIRRLYDSGQGEHKEGEKKSTKSNISITFKNTTNIREMTDDTIDYQPKDGIESHTFLSVSRVTLTLLSVQMLPPSQTCSDRTYIMIG